MKTNSLAPLESGITFRGPQNSLVEGVVPAPSLRFSAFYGPCPRLRPSKQGPSPFLRIGQQPRLTESSECSRDTRDSGCGNQRAELSGSVERPTIMRTHYPQRRLDNPHVLGGQEVPRDSWSNDPARSILLSQRFEPDRDSGSVMRRINCVARSSAGRAFLCHSNSRFNERHRREGMGRSNAACRRDRPTLTGLALCGHERFLATGLLMLCSLLTFKDKLFLQ